MNLKIIENFYSPSDFGLVVAHFVNEHFQPTHQSKEESYGGNRFNAYPCYETNFYFENNNEYSLANLFKKTFEEKTNLKLLHFKTCLRKIKLSELKKSASWGQHKPHEDNKIECDTAGIIYFNSGSLKDGTNLYKSKNDYAPTVMVGSYPNRCVFYDSSIPHQPGAEQEIEERWVQPFFAILDERVYKRWRENYAT